jgi:hypothetical protein
VRLIVEKQKGNPEKYATLAQKTVFLVEKDEFETMLDIMNDRGQELPTFDGREAMASTEKTLCTPFEESLI